MKMTNNQLAERITPKGMDAIDGAYVFEVKIGSKVVLNKCANKQMYDNVCYFWFKHKTGQAPTEAEERDARAVYDVAVYEWKQQNNFK